MLIKKKIRKNFREGRFTCLRMSIEGCSYIDKVGKVSFGYRWNIFKGM